MMRTKLGVLNCFEAVFNKEHIRNSHLVCSARANDASEAVLECPLVLPRREDVRRRMFSSTFDE